MCVLCLCAFVLSVYGQGRWLHVSTNDQKKSTKAILAVPRLGAYCQEVMDSKCIGKLNSVLVQVAGKLVEFALSVACV